MRAKVPSRWASYDGGSAGTTNTSSPPWRGRSWAPAGAAMSASSSANGRRIRHLLSTPGGEGLVRASLRKPHRVELVVQVVARRHRPALHPGVVRGDPVPLQPVHRVHLLVEQTLLELPDVLLPLLEIDRPALFYVELVENRSEEHTSELQSRLHLVCRLLLEKKKHNNGAVRTAVPPAAFPHEGR